MLSRPPDFPVSDMGYAGSVAQRGLEPRRIGAVFVLAHAYALCRSNKGAQGVDGQNFADIDAYGARQWLGELGMIGTISAKIWFNSGTGKNALSSDAILGVEMCSPDHQATDRKPTNRQCTDGDSAKRRRSHSKRQHASRGDGSGLFRDFARNW